MRRPAALVSLVLVSGVLLPAQPASACSPAPPPRLTVSQERVAAGETVLVSGLGYDRATGTGGGCPTYTMSPTPSESPSQEPSEIPSEVPSEIPSGTPSGTPSESATPTPTAEPTATPTPDPADPSATPPATPPALAGRVPAAPRAAYAPAQQPAVLTIARIAGPFDHNTQEWQTGPAVEIARAPVTRQRMDYGGTRPAFSTTATIPASLAPGAYLLEARQQGGVWFGTAEITVLAALPDTGARSTAPLARLGVLLVLAGAAAVAAGRVRASR